MDDVNYEALAAYLQDREKHGGYVVIDHTAHGHVNLATLRDIIEKLAWVEEVFSGLGIVR
jgi:hypothetical protein